MNSRPRASADEGPMSPEDRMQYLIHESGLHPHAISILDNTQSELGRLEEKDLLLCLKPDGSADEEKISARQRVVKNTGRGVQYCPIFARGCRVWLFFELARSGLVPGWRYIRTEGGDRVQSTGAGSQPPLTMLGLMSKSSKEDMDKVQEKYARRA